MICLGGVFAGVVSDYLGGRALTCMVMLLIAAPSVSSLHFTKLTVCITLSLVRGWGGGRVLWWVCLYVCMFVCQHISKTTCVNINKVSVHVAYGHGSVLVWRQCSDVVCT